MMPQNNKSMPPLESLLAILHVASGTLRWVQSVKGRHA